MGILNIYDGHHSASKAISSRPHSISDSLSPSPNSPQPSDTHRLPQLLPHFSSPHQCRPQPEIVEINWKNIYCFKISSLLQQFDNNFRMFCLTLVLLLVDFVWIVILAMVLVILFGLMVGLFRMGMGMTHGVVRNV